MVDSLTKSVPAPEATNDHSGTDNRLIQSGTKLIDQAPLTDLAASKTGIDLALQTSNADRGHETVDGLTKSAVTHNIANDHTALNATGVNNTIATGSTDTATAFQNTAGLATSDGASSLELNAIKTTKPTTTAAPVVATTVEAPPTTTSNQDKASSPSTQLEITSATNADTLHVVAALTSATNTVSHTVSVSLAPNVTLLDATQLRIIDLFLDATPDARFRTVDNTLEIYDPDASSEAIAHASVWDVGGGTFVRVIGISDGHIVS